MKYFFLFILFLIPRENDNQPSISKGYYLFCGLGCGYSNLVLENFNSCQMDANCDLNIVFFEDISKVKASEVLTSINYATLSKYEKKKYKKFRIKKTVPQLFLVDSKKSIRKIDLWEICDL